MDVYIGDMFLLIEMARKTKKTLTRAQMKKICKENANREIRVGKVKKREEGDKEKEKRKRTGMKALKKN